MATKKETAASAPTGKAAVANHETETVSVTNSGDLPSVADTTSAVDDVNRPADIAPATTVDPSGAPVQIVPDVDLSHPAVDANPRAGTTVAQNQIDFNDPTITGSQAVAKALREQGVEIVEDPSIK
ncbi:MULTISPECIES: hypothetical protein [unclassified Rhizobium]|uniref:hypothetical protein n=1 Tax=unclassified Rhizobium TaxID=2613769 RepID=UPI001AEAF4C9|nr:MULTISPECIES: hypothetical protein [unclassified Rhizobium]MBP2459593.1 hypothetical protein [Rhizobium sp. PvP014]MBP2531887.1 hypothetical protein [Rhizobium sp. PvP099]